MKYGKHLAYLLTLLTLFTALARADDLSDVQSYMQQQVAGHKFSGDVLIALHDRVVFEHAYGEANMELHVPNTLQTRFRIFSVTKQFTAAAIMALAQEGKLDVAAPAARYLPHFPAAWQQVTIADLMNHSSGIPQLENNWFQTFTEARTRQSQCENYDAMSIPSAQLTTRPGSTWRYNNFGYDLLGCVIERASGMSLAEYMQTAIFTPAGMSDSGLVGRVADPEPFYDGARAIDELATGYNGTLGVFGQLQKAMPEQYGSAGAGDIYTTVTDLWRYSEALYQGKILSAKTQQQMLEDSIPIGGGLSGPSCAPACAPLRHVTTPDVRWGLGWSIRGTPGHRYIEHSGGNNGFTADFARFPDERATIIVLSNFGFTDVTGVRSAIAQRVFHGKYTVK